VRWQARAGGVVCGEGEVAAAALVVAVAAVAAVLPVVVRSASEK